MDKKIRKISNYIWVIMIMVIFQWINIVVIGCKIIHVLESILEALK